VASLVANDVIVRKGAASAVVARRANDVIMRMTSQLASWEITLENENWLPQVLNDIEIAHKNETMLSKIARCEKLKVCGKDF